MAYVEERAVPLLAGMDSSDYISLGQMDLSDYQVALGAAAPSPMQQFRKAKYFSSPASPRVSDLPTPAFWGQKVPKALRNALRQPTVGFRFGVPSAVGFGADGAADGNTSSDVGTVVAIGAVGLVVSAAISFMVMVGASYLGARWAGCRRAA